MYERLGVGGMATVHRALEHGMEGFERVVALKRLLPHLAEDASFIKSFVREAKLASFLNHVNIVQIFELGRVGTEYFISMEYIDGRDVRRILRHARKVTGPPPIHVTVGLLLQLCDALDYAHTKTDDSGQPLGLVHRDVSPSNLLVTSAGHLKVIDFGIAKAQSSQLRTQTGRVKGKLAYMAPEAISGKELDARSDLFAVGVIGHELLTARPLFASKNEYQTLLKVQRGDIMPPSTFNQGCPKELDAIVLKALARDPDERFSTALDLRDELLRLRNKYNLQTSYRDVATWLDWAFSLEVPTGGFAGGNTLDQTGSAFNVMGRSTPLPTPVPRRKDEDEAVEIAWGGGEEPGTSGPIVLDEIPDVSEKMRVRPLEAEVDLSDLDDDIPTPLPSHGPAQASGASHGPAPVAAQAAVSAAVIAKPTMPTRPSGSIPSVPMPAGSSLSTPAAAKAVPRATGSMPVATPARTTGTGQMPVQPARTTGPVPAQRTTGSLPVAADPEAIVAPAASRTTTPTAQLARTTRTVTIPPLSAPAPASAPVRTPQGSGVTAPKQELGLGSERRAESQSEGNITARRAQETGPVPAAVARPTPPPMAALRTRDPSTPPATTTAPLPAVTPIEPELGAAATLRGVAAASTAPTMMAPASDAALASTIAAPDAARTQLGHGIVKNRRARPVTSSAFADPEPAAAPSSAPAFGEDLLKRGEKKRRTGLIITGLVAATAAAAGGVAFVVVHDKEVIVAPTDPTRTPAKTIGTVKFVMQPEDAIVAIEGQPPHTGSPWAIDLQPGVHQIEIHRDAYKSWLTSIEVAPGETQTLRVVLERLTSDAPQTDATLILASTPSGLETVLDGAVLPQRTPIKMPVKPGTHSISLRLNGVDVWRKDINAHAAADYEFNPIVERTMPRPAQPAIREPAVAREETPAPKAAIEAAPLNPADRAAEAHPTPTPPVAPPPVQPVTPPTPAPAGSGSVAHVTTGKIFAPTGAPTPTPAPAPPTTTTTTRPTPPITTGAPPAPAITTSAPPHPSVPVANPIPRGPVTVPPTAVTRISGGTDVTRIKGTEIPPVIAAKVCIDTSGKVAAADLLTKIEKHTGAELVESIRGWRYQPYVKDGAPTPACFVVSFRVK
ncbi:MAG TPA: protein kinase [Kofleriaceae bacterium]